MRTNDIIVFFIAGTALLIVFTFFLIVLFAAQRSRRQKFRMEKEKIKAENENKVLQAKIDTQELTMSNISMEIHDNISQLLYLLQTNLKVIKRENPGLQHSDLLTYTLKLTDTVLQDVQNLSHTMNGELLQGIGLLRSLQIEIERLDNRQQLRATIDVEGAVYELPKEKELMIFRIAQEAIHNTLKHAGAGLLGITLAYTADGFYMSIADDGTGFEKEQMFATKGMGMLSMHQRARLINGTLQLSSTPGQGTVINFSLPLPS